MLHSLSQVSLHHYATLVISHIILTECCWFPACVGFIIITSAQKAVRAATSDWSCVSCPRHHFSELLWVLGGIFMQLIWQSSLWCSKFSRAKIKKCPPPKFWKWEQHMWIDFWWYWPTRSSAGWGAYKTRLCRGLISGQRRVNTKQVHFPTEDIGMRSDIGILFCFFFPN